MKDDQQYRQLVQKHQRSIEVVQCDENKQETTASNDQHNLEEQRGHIRKANHAAKQQMRRTLDNINTQLDQTMVQTMVDAMDVAEAYSPPPPPSHEHLR